MDHCGQLLKGYLSGHPIHHDASHIILLEQISTSSDNCQESTELENAFFQSKKKGIKSTLLPSGTDSGILLQSVLGTH